MDLRPIIARGEHPLTSVMRAAHELEPGGMLELVAPFEPRPLMTRLGEAGCEVRASEEAGGSWLVHAGRPSLAPIADYRDLVAPEPLERLLEAASALAPGGVHVAYLPRDPILAKPHLEARALGWQVAMRPDGTALVWVGR